MDHTVASRVHKSTLTTVEIMFVNTSTVGMNFVLESSVHLYWTNPMTYFFSIVSLKEIQIQDRVL